MEWYRAWKAEDPIRTPEGLHIWDRLWRTNSHLILWYLSVKYARSQLSAFPVTPNQSSSLLSRIVWSMVSKAIERSSIVSAVTLPASTDARISLWIFSRAVSVEWNFLYADWYWLDVFELLKCVFSWFTITFSRTLEKKLRLDTGR